MQSGYGGVSEFQQFMMDGCAAASPAALFSISTAGAPPQQAAAAQPPDMAASAPFRYQPLHHPLPHHHPAPPPQIPPHFTHFAGAAGAIPFTHQLLAAASGGGGGGHHQFQLFHEQKQAQPARWAPHPHHHHHHHHLGLDVESSAPESSGGGSAGGGGHAASGGMPPFLAAAMSFKLAVDAGAHSAATGGDDGMNDGTGGGMILHGGGGGGEEEAATESRLRRWPGDEEAAIKEPTWRPLDIDYINSSSSNSKRGKDKAPESSPPPPPPPAAANYFKKSDDNAVTAAAATGVIDIAAGNHPAAAAAAAAAAGGGNYKLFSELEAIYKPGSSGSGSGLTGDDNAVIPSAAAAAMADLGPPAMEVRHIGTSETSAGEDAAAVQKPDGGAAAAAAAAAMRQRKRKRRQRQQQQELSASAAFFERLVQQLMEHQEGLHQKFLDAMDRRERERAARDEAWRRQEAAKAAREAAARSQDSALAAAREASIISFLEKITGETVVLPLPTSSPVTNMEMQDNCNRKDMAMVSFVNNSDNDGNTDGGSGRVLQFSTSRWPKAEVEALIRVRTGLESRFQEPGLKGPLWEEVSARMAAAGYRRSAKRCKEKWENINKYFRKAKESGKKRPAHAKTCPYFHELDRLYSRSAAGNAGATIADANANANANPADGGNGMKASSELLDAVVKYPDFGPPGFMFDGEGGINAAGDHRMDRGGNVTGEDGRRTNNDGDDDDEREEDGEEGEGEGDEEEEEGVRGREHDDEEVESHGHEH